MYVWNSTKELYDILVQMPDLHSVPTFNGNVLYWNLFKNAYVRAYFDSKDFYIEIVGTALSNSGSVRWLTDKNSMLQELYSLGKKGNICVIKKTLLGSSVFYMGNPLQYPLPDRRSWDFGKKKYEFGTLIYLEQRQ